MSSKKEWARWVSVDPVAADYLKNLCPVNTAVVLDSRTIATTAGTALHSDLLRKSPAITVAASRLPNTDIELRVIIYHRTEDDKKLIDHTSFGILYSRHGTQSSGCYSQHGEYDRETVLSEDDWTHFVASGIEDLREKCGIPTVESGSVFDLPEKARKAFEKVFEYHHPTLTALM